MKTKLLLLLALTLGACSADVAPPVESSRSSGDENVLYDDTGLAPIADVEAAKLVDQDSPSFKAWLDANYGAQKLGDDRVGAKLEKIISFNTCNNNNVGHVTTSTPLGKGAAMCAAAMWPSGYYACSGSFSSGTCILAFGSGTGTTSVSSCGSASGAVTWPGAGSFSQVVYVNKCTGGTAGRVYAGLRPPAYPSMVYESFADLHGYARTDLQNTSQAVQSWGY